MTHLLATLLTGGPLGALNRLRSRAAGNTEPDSRPGFEQLLREQPAKSEDRSNEVTREAEQMKDRPTGKEPSPESKGKNQMNPSSTELPVDPGSPLTGVTLLGSSLGSRIQVPALTFMLPAGSGPEDLASAIRTQVLRFASVRNLEPGSLDNLRIAISSRELGQVEVDLSVRDGKLEVDIVASGREAESVLRKTSGDLREALLARTDRFRQVDVKVSIRAGQEEDTPERNSGRGSGRNQDQRPEGDQGQRPGEPGPDQTEDQT